MWLNVFRIFLLFLALALILVVVVVFTVDSATEKVSLASVYMRIFVNHCQLIILTASFQLDWPSVIRYILYIPDPLANVTTHFLSWDCFMDSRSTTSDVNSPSLFYVKLVVMLILPVVTVIISTVLCVLVGCCFKLPRPKVINLTITTVLLVIFITHPSLSETILDTVK